MVNIAMRNIPGFDRSAVVEQREQRNLGGAQVARRRSPGRTHTDLRNVSCFEAGAADVGHMVVAYATMAAMLGAGMLVFLFGPEPKVPVGTAYTEAVGRKGDGREFANRSPSQ